MRTSKHKSKSTKSHRWGAWSEWTWDSTHQTNVRVRQDSQGQLEYDWDQQDLNPAQTPREAAVEDITERLSSLSPTANEAHSEEYAYLGAAPEESKSRKSKSKSKEKEKEKEKEKSHRRHASSDDKSSTASQGDVAYMQSTGLQYAESTYGAEYQRPQLATNVNYSRYGSARTSYSAGVPLPSRYGAFAQENAPPPKQAAMMPEAYGKGVHRSGRYDSFVQESEASSSQAAPIPETYTKSAHRSSRHAAFTQESEASPSQATTVPETYNKGIIQPSRHIDFVPESEASSSQAPAVLGTYSKSYGPNRHATFVPESESFSSQTTAVPETHSESHRPRRHAAFVQEGKESSSQTATVSETYSKGVDRPRRPAAFVQDSETTSNQVTVTTESYQAVGAPETDSKGIHRPSRRAQFVDESQLSSSQATAGAELYTEVATEMVTSLYGGAHHKSERSPTPQPETTQEDDYISAAVGGEQGSLDPRYRIEHSSMFQPGEIFKIHWSEPEGSTSEPPKSSSSKTDAQDTPPSKFYFGFRRFIVVANDQGHCTCVPILTYGGKACKKRGVKPDKHGIIYERGQKAKKLDGEPSMGFSPVRVEMTEEGEKISRDSRVNYSKLVTVEHNVRVFFIGHVYPSDWQIVGDAVNHCWNKKIHQKQRHR